MASLRRPCLPGVCSSASGASSCAPAPPCGLARPRRHAFQLPTSSGALKSAGALQECFGRPASPPACHCGSAYQLQAGLRLGEVRPGGRAQGQITKPLGSSRLSCAQTPCYVGTQGCNDGDGVPPAMHSARDVEKGSAAGQEGATPQQPSWGCGTHRVVHRCRPLLPGRDGLLPQRQEAVLSEYLRPCNVNHTARPLSFIPRTRLC